MKIVLVSNCKPLYELLLELGHPEEDIIRLPSREAVEDYLYGIETAPAEVPLFISDFECSVGYHEAIWPPELFSKATKKRVQVLALRSGRFDDPDPKDLVDWHFIPRDEPQLSKGGIESFLKSAA